MQWREHAQRRSLRAALLRKACVHVGSVLSLALGIGGGVSVSSAHRHHLARLPLPPATALAAEQPAPRRGHATRADVRAARQDQGARNVFGDHPTARSPAAHRADAAAAEPASCNWYRASFSGVRQRARVAADRAAATLPGRPSVTVILVVLAAPLRSQPTSLHGAPRRRATLPGWCRRRRFCDVVALLNPDVCFLDMLQTRFATRSTPHV